MANETELPEHLKTNGMKSMEENIKTMQVRAIHPEGRLAPKKLPLSEKVLRLEHQMEQRNCEIVELREQIRVLMERVCVLEGEVLSD